jgi:hypothetical protein
LVQGPTLCKFSRMAQQPGTGIGLIRLIITSYISNEMKRKPVFYRQDNPVIRTSSRLKDAGYRLRKGPVRIVSGQ